MSRLFLFLMALPLLAQPYDIVLANGRVIDVAMNRAATPAEFAEVKAGMEQGLREGALGFGFGIAYLPKTPREQIYELLGMAATRKVGSFMHLRYGGPVEPGYMDALQEVIA